MKLLYLNLEEIKKYTDSLVKQANLIKKNAQRLAWSSRGGISYNDVLNMSTEEISSLNSLVDENIEVTKKTSLPYF
jgi:hypothetical protein